MRPIVAYALACGAALPSPAAVDAAEMPVSGRPSIVLIVIDTLRADHLGCYGYPRPTSPVIDSLAADSMLFWRAYSPSSWTLPAMASVMTAVLPSVHGVIRSDRSCPDRWGTFVQNLREVGYYCSGVVSNPLLDHHFGFARGFDQYDDYSVLLQVEGDVLEGAVGGNVRTVLSAPFTHWVAAHQLQKECLKRTPFFLLVHYFDPHDRYIPPESTLRLFRQGIYRGDFSGDVASLYQDPPKASAEDIQYLVDLYDAEIRYTDKYVGKLLGLLKRQKVYDDALIVVFSDHGEEFYDHGGVHHGHSLYEELVRVPLIIKLPKNFRGGTKVVEPVSTLSLGPTLLEYCRAKPMEGVQGRGFLSLLVPGRGSSFREMPIVAETHDWTPVGTPLRMAILGGHKAIWSIHGEKLLAAFSLQGDAKELNNLAVGEAGPLAWIQGLASACKRSMHLSRAVAQTRRLEADDKLIRRLKDLGYLQ